MKMKHLSGLFVFLILGFTAWTQEPDDPLDITPDYKPIEDTISTDIQIFGTDNPLVCTLKFDIKKFVKEKYKDQYQKALLTYHFNDSVELERTIHIKARGEFRKTYCLFPPIKINLKKSKIQYGGMKGVTSLKFVTHCRPSQKYEQYVLKEYLIYKLYNLLTDYSFRVKLMQIRYIDTGSRKPKEYLRYGFIIEDIDMLAERSNTIEVKINTISQKYIDRVSMNRVALFQYFIGNTDWSVPELHNLKLLKLNDPLKVTPFVVPYDFDYSGFVNASYAIPNEIFEIDNVTKRLFLGICRSSEEYNASIKEFLAQKDSIYHTIREFEYLNDQTKKKILKYIDEFYTIIESESLIRRKIIATCKKL